MNYQILCPPSENPEIWFYYWHPKGYFPTVVKINNLDYYFIWFSSLDNIKWDKNTKGEVNVVIVEELALKHIHDTMTILLEKRFFDKIKKLPRNKYKNYLEISPL